MQIKNIDMPLLVISNQNLISCKRRLFRKQFKIPKNVYITVFIFLFDLLFHDTLN